MKTAVFFTLLLASAVMAQPPPPERLSNGTIPAAGAPPPASGTELRTKVPAPVPPPAAREPRTSGAIPKAVRTPNPLKLIDPRAPREMGDGYDNVSRDPVTGRAEGIRLFTVTF